MRPNLLAVALRSRLLFTGQDRWPGEPADRHRDTVAGYDIRRPLRWLRGQAITVDWGHGGLIETEDPSGGVVGDFDADLGDAASVGASMGHSSILAGGS